MSDLIDEIEEIRENNNSLWMGILRLALEHAPDRARKLLSQINLNDSAISARLKRLSEEL